MREFKVTMTRYYEIVILAESEERAIEIADETPLSDLGWDLTDVEYDAEED